MAPRRLLKSRIEHQNDEFEANPALETPLAASLATRASETIGTTVEIANSNPNSGL